MPDFRSGGDRIADLIIRQGDIAAHNAAISGAIWGNQVSGLGAMAGNVTGQILQQKQDEQAAQQKAAQQQIQQQQRVQMTHQILSNADPSKPEDTMSGLIQAGYSADDALKLTNGVQGWHKIDPNAKKQDWEAFGHTLTGASILYKQGGDKALADAWPSLQPKLAKGADEMGYTIGPDYKPEYGQMIAAADAHVNKGEKPPSVGSKEWFVKLTAGDNPTPEAAQSALAKYEATQHMPEKTDAQKASSAYAEEAARLQARKKFGDQEAQADYSPDVKTSSGGTKFIETSSYLGKDRTAAQQWARANGVKQVGKEDAATLAEIDGAKRNNADILSQLEGKLASSPAGRLVKGPSNKLSAFFQTDEDLAAFGAWRTAAIRNLRATAGGKGLRINKAEIEQAVENDIPTLSDTMETAKKKLSIVNRLLDNSEASILGDSGTSGAGWNDVAPGVRIRVKP